MFSISLIFSLAISTAFANSAFSDKADEVFKKTFPGAEAITWSTEGEYRKASFVLYGRRIQALFSAEGDLVGTVRNTHYSDLPIKVMLAIKNRFNNAAPFAITEINRLDGTEYKFSLEINSERVLVYMTSGGELIRINPRKRRN
jgi:hypothetical protein